MASLRGLLQNILDRTDLDEKISGAFKPQNINAYKQNLSNTAQRVINAPPPKLNIPTIQRQAPQIKQLPNTRVPIIPYQMARYSISGANQALNQGRNAYNSLAQSANQGSQQFRQRFINAPTTQDKFRVSMSQASGLPEELLAGTKPRNLSQEGKNKLSEFTMNYGGLVNPINEVRGVGFKKFFDNNTAKRIATLQQKVKNGNESVATANEVYELARKYLPENDIKKFNYKQMLNQLDLMLTKDQRVAYKEIPQRARGIIRDAQPTKGKLGGQEGFIDLNAKIETPEAITKATQKLKSVFQPSEDIVAQKGPVIQKQQPIKVDQTFKTEKFNVDKKQTKTLNNLLKTLGLEERSVKSFDDMKAVAEELGTDPGKLMKEIQSGRITDSEVVALSNTINTSTKRIESLTKELKQNPANKELAAKLQAEEQLLNNAIRKQIKGGTEAGRAVVAFKIIANKTMEPSYWLTKAQRQLGGADLKPEQVNAINQLIKENDRLGLAKFVSMLGESSMRDKAVGLWKAGLLTSLRTHEANVFANAVFGGLETIKDIPATGFDIARSTITRKPRATTFSIKGLTNQGSGAVEGAKQAKKYFIEGIDVRDAGKLDFYKPLRFGESKAGRLAQKYTDTIFGALGSEDKVFREMAVSRSLANQAAVEGINNNLTTKQISELIQNPTKEMIEQAVKDAEYATFNNPNAVSDAVRAAKAGGGPVVSSILDFTMPFVRTPTNVLKAVIDYTPVGIVSKTVQKITNGSNVTNKELAEAFGRSVTGTGLIWAGYKLAEAGKIQGATPQSEAQRSQMYLEGRQGNSIEINGKWRKIDRFSPIGNLIVLGSEFYNSGKNLPQTAAAGIKSLSEQSFLQGASQALSAVNDPSRGAKKYVEGAVGGMVPNIVKDIARGGDEYMRDTDSSLDAIKYGLPGVRETLPTKLDALGKPVQQEGGYGTALLDPTNPKSVATNPLIQEMARVDYNLNYVGDTLGGKKLTPQEQRNYQRLAGQQIERFVPAVISSEAYQQADIDTQRSLIEKAVNKAKDQAREQIKADQSLLGKSDSGISASASEAMPEKLGEVGVAPAKTEYSYVDGEGSLKIVDISPVEKPKLTGKEALDKKLVSSYKSAITRKINSVVDLYEAEQITEAEAEALINQFSEEYDALSSGKKAKKLSKPKAIKVTSPKAIKAPKFSSPSVSKAPTITPFKITPFKPAKINTNISTNKINTSIRNPGKIRFSLG